MSSNGVDIHNDENSLYREQPCAWRSSKCMNSLVFKISCGDGGWYYSHVQDGETEVQHIREACEEHSVRGRYVHLQATPSGLRACRLITLTSPVDLLVIESTLNVHAKDHHKDKNKH